jgi:uncharacterized membrane protein
VTATASIPAGLTRNPSAWRERLLLAAIATAGAVISAYLACYQLKLIDSVSDPIFGASSSHAVLFSSFSTSLPVPDALLGTLNYLAEIVLDLIGGEDRWRTRPVVVLLFGALLGLGALVSIGLILMQAFVVGHFCTLCLISAGLSILLAVLGSREVRAAWGTYRGR